MESERKGRKDGESERGVVCDWKKKRERRKERESFSPWSYRGEETVMHPQPVNQHHFDTVKTTRRPKRAKNH